MVDIEYAAVNFLLYTTEIVNFPSFHLQIGGDFIVFQWLSCQGLTVKNSDKFIIPLFYTVGVVICTRIGSVEW